MKLKWTIVNTFKRLSIAGDTMLTEVIVCSNRQFSNLIHLQLIAAQAQMKIKILEKV